MNPILNKIITRFILQPKSKWKDGDEEYSPYDVAKGFLELKQVLRSFFLDALFITLGIFCAGFGLKGFLLTNGFIDGGATGISLLIAQLQNASLSIVILLVNLPFLILGFRVIGKLFAIKAVLAIIGLAICVAFVPFPEITNDKLLIAVFGGFFLGAGIGLTVRGGAVIDGTEILAISLSRRRSMTVGDFIMVFNVIIFSTAVWLLNVNTALYAMLTYLA